MDSPTIIFEDSDILVVDKPSGLVVNRSDTTKNSITLQEWAELKIQDPRPKIQNPESEFQKRGGIVHRLDRETSGIIIIAKNEQAFINLQAQFKNRTVKKKYIALVHGKLKDDAGIINSKIARVGDFGKFGVSEGGRESQTEYKVEERLEFSEDKIDQLLEENDILLNKNRVSYLKNHAREYSLIYVYPATGRTHQIRVHMKSIGHTLVSDLIYGPSKLLKFDLLWCSRLFLHANTIAFDHPTTGERVEFESPLPDELSKFLSKLN